MPSELTWRVSADDLPSVGVRLRLYGCERLRRERMIGEAIVPLTTVSIEQQTPQWLVLQPRANITVSSSTENTATRLAGRWPIIWRTTPRLDGDGFRQPVSLVKAILYPSDTFPTLPLVTGH